MTQTITLWPIIKAIFQATLFLSPGAQKLPDNWHTRWQPDNERQEVFLKDYLGEHRYLDKFKPDELKAWASTDYQELNAILEKENFAIRLEKFLPPDFGVVAILDVMMEWATAGRERGITAKNGRTYPGVRMKDGFSVFTSAQHAHRIVRLATKSGDTVWLTIADTFKSEFEIIPYINTIKKNLVPDDSYHKVDFPKVDLDVQPNIEWLLGMKYPIGLNEFAVIVQAKQQTKLKMNELGAHVKSAVALQLELTAVPAEDQKVLVIDQPFLCWIEKPGIPIPVFAGYLDIDVWSDPGSLSMEPGKPVAVHEEAEQASTPISWWQEVVHKISEAWSAIVSYFDKK